MLLLDKIGLGLVCDVRDICGSAKVDDGIDVEDADASNLSHVGTAAYDALRKEHNKHHHTLWNVTKGKMIGELHQTPLKAFPRDESDERTGDLPDGHDDWFPDKLCEIMSRTEVWCDVMSLGPPDGVFVDAFKKALANIAEKAQGKDEPIRVRMMFGNIPAMPVNCTAVLKSLTEDLPEDVNIHVWVGAWRKGVSWNHAKIIAIDGKYLWTGGHNLWDKHYLREDPVHDLSLELEGRVCVDGHRFANEQWTFIKNSQSTLIGYCIDKMPDYLPMAMATRVTVTEFPKGSAPVFPPSFTTSVMTEKNNDEGTIPIITMGRYGAMLKTDRPSDDGILAMMYSAKKIIRFALQDLGPVCIPGTCTPLPGCVWPHTYLNAIARVMWNKEVDIEIILSNPNSIPGKLSGTEANYGNGWSCVDVAAEIIKKIKLRFPEAEHDEVRKKVEENLRVSFIRHKSGNKYEGGMNLGMHAKHFIVDDVCTYIGSQNLYVCDLAEWGVVIDDEETTKKIMDEYWNPMWKVSYNPEDCDVQAVMDGLDIDRDGDTSGEVDKNAAALAAAGGGQLPGKSEWMGDAENEII